MDEILQEMIELEKEWDKEKVHLDADDLLCEVLEILGQKEIVAAFKKLDKWYA